MWTIRVVGLVLMAITLQTGCAKPEAQQPALKEEIHADAPLMDSGGGPGRVVRAVAPRASEIELATWNESLSRQAPSDQEYLRGLDHRYFGALSFVNEKELAFMTAGGFPTPEEWLSARDLTDKQLQGRADAGDHKAAGMFADRMSLRLQELMAINDSDPGSVPDRDKVLLATMAVMYSSNAMEGHQDLFGTYVQGMVKSSIHNSWEPMTAAILVGMNEGDPRADRLIRELSARHPRQDVSAIHAALKVSNASRPTR